MMNETQAKLLGLLERAIAAEGADKGTLQRYIPSVKELVIAAQVGFDTQFMEHFKSVKPFDSSVCGRAFGIGSPIAINDVQKDIGFAPHLKVARDAGFRAVKSVPVFTNDRRCIGVLSTHYKDPKEVWSVNPLDDIFPELIPLLLHSDPAFNLSFK
jgi:GAF domain-containing protein